MRTHASKCERPEQQQPLPRVVASVLTTAGRPLDAETRAVMEPRFGHDFTNVRVHTDGEAARSARAVRAQAYTYGHDIVFGAGRYAPATDAGRRLLEHELTHVVEQRSGPPTIARQPEDPPSDTLTPADVAHLETSLRTMMGRVDANTRARILRYDTVALGLVRDPDGDLTLVYTVAGNRTYAGLQAAADAVGATRWQATPRAAGRGAAVGAPGDAEQLLIEAATTNSFRVVGMAVTRAVCSDCAEAATAERRGGVRVTHVGFAMPAPPRPNASGAAAVPSPGAAPARLPATRPPISVSGSRAPRGMPSGRGGGPGIRGGVAVEGAAALVEAVAMPIFLNYLQEHYALSNSEEARKEIAGTLEASRPFFEILIKAESAKIQKAQQEGKKVFLHVIVDTNWADTSIGRVLDKASLARSEIVIEDGPPPKPYSTPSPGWIFGEAVRELGGVTLDFEEFYIELEGTNPEAADRRLRDKVIAAQLRASRLGRGAFVSLIVQNLEYALPMDDLREYARGQRRLAEEMRVSDRVMQEILYWTAMERLIDGPAEHLIAAAKREGIPLEFLRGVALSRSREPAPGDRYGAEFWAELVRLIDAR